MSLQIQYTEIVQRVGRTLGYNSDSTKWTADQTLTVANILKSGLRQFLYPPPLPGKETAHKWSFLGPAGKITLEIGKTAYELPDDLASIDGGVLMFAEETERSDAPPVRVVSHEVIYQNILNEPARTGRPILAELAMAAHLGEETQKVWLGVWPKPDKAYNLTFMYQIRVPGLSVLLPYPPGGPEHSETLLASCLAVAEIEENDDPAGPNLQRFMRCLAASVAIDQQANVPSTLGYNGDWTDTQPQPRRSGRVGFTLPDYVS